MKWETQPIESFCLKVTSGGTPKTTNEEYYGGDIPWLRTQEVNFEPVWDTEIHITEKGYKNSSAKWIPENSVVIAMYGASAGRSALTKIPLTTNQACCNLIINHDKADYRYVYYALVRDFEALESLAKGAAQRNLNAGDLKKYQISSPPKILQTRIADTLSRYDDLIANNRRRMALLEESARLLFREWFVYLRFPGHERVKVRDGVPEGWEKCILSDVAEVNRESIGKAYDGEIEYVDIASVTPGSINETTTVDIREAPGRARRKVCHGDVIWSCVRPNRRSHAVVMHPAENLIVSTGFAVLTPVSVPTSYLYFFTTTDAFVGYLSSVAKGAAYPAVVAKDFEQARFTKPSASLLEEFDRYCSPVFEQIHRLRNQTHRLQTARDLLLPRLMSGEVEV